MKQKEQQGEEENAVYVGAGLDYATLDEAVAGAPEGSKIILAAGEYTLSVVISKNLEIVGPNANLTVKEFAKEEALRSESFYVTERWLGGTLTNFKTIRLDDMIEYIEANGNDTDKAEFKAKAFVNGKYSHLVAVRYFCGKYFPNLKVDRSI